MKQKKTDKANKSSDIKEQQRFCFVKDDDSHLYIIPYEMKEEFNDLHDQSYETEDFDLFEEKFQKYRQGASLSSFSFENPKYEND